MKNPREYLHQHGNLSTGFHPSRFSEPDADETTFASNETTFAQIPGRIIQNQISNEHSRPAPDWVPEIVVELLLELKAYVESLMRVPYIFTLPDFGSEGEDIILGKVKLISGLNSTSRSLIASPLITYGREMLEKNGPGYDQILLIQRQAKSDGGKIGGKATGLRKRTDKSGVPGKCSGCGAFAPTKLGKNGKWSEHKIRCPVDTNRRISCLGEGHPRVIFQFDFSL
jgi:hypothetical protein